MVSKCARLRDLSSPGCKESSTTSTLCSFISRPAVHSTKAHNYYSSFLFLLFFCMISLQKYIKCGSVQSRVTMTYLRDIAKQLFCKLQKNIQNLLQVAHRALYRNTLFPSLLKFPTCCHFHIFNTTNITTTTD